MNTRAPQLPPDPPINEQRRYVVKRARASLNNLWDANGSMKTYMLLGVLDDILCALELLDNIKEDE